MVLNCSVLPQSTENLPGSDADKGEYLPNEHGTEQPAKEDLDVENNSVLPTTSGDNGESSPKGDGTQSHVTEDINVENNSVLPQVEGHQGKLPPMKWTYSYVIKEILLQTEMTCKYLTKEILIKMDTKQI